MGKVRLFIRLWELMASPLFRYKERIAIRRYPDSGRLLEQFLIILDF